jgi:hypothetical protein
MTTSQQKVYLITESQQEALLNYLQNRPYKEVAVGIQFLLNAPTAVLNIRNSDLEESPTETKPEDETITELTPEISIEA